MNPNESKAGGDRLLDTPIPRLILALGIPGIVSMMITTVYNMVDTWFVSRLGTQAVAACGVTLSIMEMMQSVGYMFGTGGSTVIGILLGARRREEASRVGSTAFFATMAIGVAAAGLGVAFIRPLMRFLGASETILPYAVDYGVFILLGFPVMSGSLVLSAILRSEGRMKQSMLGVGLGGVLNIVLDPIFIFALNLGVGGAALATFISQLSGFLLLLSYYVRGMSEVKLSARLISLRAPVLRRILVTGLPSLTRHGVVMISNTCMNIAAGLYGGDALIAGLSIAGKVMSLLMAVIKGVFQGATTIFSYNRGAGRYDRVKQTYVTALFTDIVLAALFAAALTPSAEAVMRLFNATDPQVISLGAQALRVQVLSLAAMAIGFSANQLLQAVGEPMKSTLLAALPQGVFYIPAVFWLPRVFGAQGVCYAPAVGYVLTALIAVPVAADYFRKHRMPEKA